MTPDGPMTDMLAEYRRELARTRRADDWEARVIVAHVLQTRHGDDSAEAEYAWRRVEE